MLNTGRPFIATVSGVQVTPSNVDQQIPSGLYDGTVGSGKVKAVVVPASSVLTGTTIAGTNGTMPNNGALNFTPTSSSQSIPAGYSTGGSVSAIPSGTYKHFATGTTTSSSYLTISGLSFTPIFVVAHLVAPGPSMICCTIVADSSGMFYYGKSNIQCIKTRGGSTDTTATTSYFSQAFGTTMNLPVDGAALDFRWYAIG